MSWALGDSACQGWYDKGPHGKRSTFSKFSKIEFEELFNGAVLYHAVLEAMKAGIGPQFLIDPAEHFRIYGLENIFELRIID